MGCLKGQWLLEAVVVALVAATSCGQQQAVVQAPVTEPEPEAEDQPVPEPEQVIEAVTPSGPVRGWAGVLAGDPNAIAHDVAALPDGGLVVVGGFFDRIDVDPGSGEEFRMSQGGYDAFVVCVDPSGGLRWARTFGGTEDDHAEDVVVSADGSVFVGGDFGGVVNFNPGAGVSERTSNGELDVFIAKLDGNGALEWVQSYGGPGQNRVGGVAAAPDGSVLLTGYFFDVVDFDPGPGTDERASAGGRDVFVLRLGSSGQRIWTRTYGGGGEDFSFEVVVGADGSSFLGGRFNGTADFDPGPAVQERTAESGADDAYILKLEAAGHFAWVRPVGGVDRQEVSSLAVDGDGGVYFGGIFNGTLDLDPTQHGDEHAANGRYDMFVVHLGGDGSVHRSTVWSGQEEDLVTDLAVSADGSVLVVGWFGEKLDLDPGRGVFEPSVHGRHDAFVVLLDPDGAFRWAWGFGGNAEDAAMAAVSLDDETFAVVGHFTDGVDLDPGPELDEREALGINDTFIITLHDG